MKNKYLSFSKSWNHGVQNLFRFADKYFTPVMAKIGENRYLQTIRNGVVSALPMILLGSLFSVIYFFPIGEHTASDGTSYDSFGAWILYQSGHPEWASFLLLPYRLTFAIMGFFIVLGMAKALATFYKLDTQQAAFIAIIGYLLSIIGPTYEGVSAPTILTSDMGSTSIFGGGVIAILSVEVFRFCIVHKISIRLPKQVPAVVAKPFEAIIALSFVIIPCTLVFQVLKFDINSFTTFLFTPLQDFFAGNNVGGMVVIILLICLLWIAGIHGASIIGSLARPFWLIALGSGDSILTEPFYQWFVWIGGAGATIGLIISMLFVSRSKYGKSITSASAIPCLFNINEPIMFGFPIVMNPIFLIPFILAPLVMGLLSYLVIFLGWVSLPVLQPAWTLPCPVGAFFATLDWKAVILCLVMILVSVLIWWPFAKIYDKSLLKQEREQTFNEELEKLKKQGITNIDENALMKQIALDQKNTYKPIISFKSFKSFKNFKKNKSIVQNK